MRVVVQVEGIDDALGKFGGMISKAKGPDFPKKMDELAERLVEEMKANAPVSRALYTPPGHEPGTLRDHGIGYHRITHGGLTAVYIGFTQIGWYGRYPEFGTVHMAAQPFIIPTFDRNRDAIVSAIADAYGNGFLTI